tara:strand:- start:56 stop:373 length:318 start_codon:yes stop_codon:yes gene_type:complete
LVYKSRGSLTPLEWSRTKQRIIIMENFYKAVKMLNAVMVILILFGLVLSSNARSNLFELGESLLNAGLLGILTLFILLWYLKGTPSTLLKLIKAKGFNSRFWNDL